MKRVVKPQSSHFPAQELHPIGLASPKKALDSQEGQHLCVPRAWLRSRNLEQLCFSPVVFFG
jgi:hypothetical protein